MWFPTDSLYLEYRKSHYIVAANNAKVIYFKIMFQKCGTCSVRLQRRYARHFHVLMHTAQVKMVRASGAIIMARSVPVHTHAYVPAGLLRLLASRWRYLSVSSARVLMAVFSASAAWYSAAGGKMLAVRRAWQRAAAEARKSVYAGSGIKQLQNGA